MNLEEADPDYSDFKRVEHAIGAIYDKNGNDLTSEELSRISEKFVQEIFGESVYSGLISITTLHLENVAKSVEASEDSEFLEELSQKWMDFNTALVEIGQVLKFMDLTFVRNTRKTPVHVVCRNIWRDNIINSSNIAIRLKSTLLEAVKKERAGIYVAKFLVRDTVKMLMYMGNAIYKDCFEIPYLVYWSTDCASESRIWIETLDCGTYIDRIERKLEAEIKRVFHYHSVKIKKVKYVFRKKMIECHLKRLLESEEWGFIHLMKEEMYLDLGRFYNLLSQYSSHQMFKAICSYIQKIGEQLVADPERHLNPVGFVERMIDEKEKLERIMNVTYYNNNTWFLERPINLYSLVPQFSVGLQPQLQELISPGLLKMIENDDHLKIRRLYNCLNTHGSLLNPMQDILSSNIQKNGLEVMDPQWCRDPSVVLHILCDLKAKYDSIIKHGFENDVNCRCMLGDWCGHFFTLEPRFPELISSELSKMIEDDEHLKINRHYVFLGSFLVGTKMMKDVLESHIRKAWEQLMMDARTDLFVLVQLLLELIGKYNEIIKHGFNNDGDFRFILISLFGCFLKSKPQIPEIISLHVDDQFRKGVKGESESELMVLLDKVKMLYDCLEEKHIFEKYYKRHLGARLLSGNSLTEDMEISFVMNPGDKAFGNLFALNAERMLTDIQNSRETMQGFYIQTGRTVSDMPTIAVNAVSAWLWETQPNTPCNLPADITVLSNSFSSYYHRANEGRQLTWQTDMGSAIIEATFDKGRTHELEASTYQMCILMLFKNADQLTYTDIHMAVAIPENDLKQCLWSLVFIPGKNILRKSPESKTIQAGDEFYFNEEFSTESYKVKLETTNVRKQTTPEKEEMIRKLEEDRKPLVTAIIMKVMKQKRMMKYSDIVVAVREELKLRFKPTHQMLKKGIAALVSMEMLERDKENKMVYWYRD